MNSSERNEIRELRDRIIKLETLVETDFKHLNENLKAITESLRKLNEEYGNLIQKQHELETKSKESIMIWKILAVVVSPSVTAVLLWLVRTILNL